VSVLPRALLAELAARQLLGVVDEERYILSPSVRRYFAQKRRSQPDLDQVTRQRFCSVIADWVATANAQANGGARRDLARRLNTEWVHLHLAWRCALEQGQITALERLWLGIECIYDEYGLRTEGEAFCADVLAHLPVTASALLVKSLRLAQARFREHRL
jgi:hypothetical protein